MNTNKIMTRQDFINYLVKLGVPFSEYTENGADMIYIHSRKEYEEKRNHPRKNKDLFVPYIRVSHFDELPRLYTRNNGYCCYMKLEDVISIVKEYSK